MKNHMRDGFTGRKTLRKVEDTYSALKLIKA